MELACQRCRHPIPINDLADLYLGIMCPQCQTGYQLLPQDQIQRTQINVFGGDYAAGSIIKGSAINPADTRAVDNQDEHRLPKQHQGD